MNAPAKEALERIGDIFDNAIAREHAKQKRYQKEHEDDVWPDTEEGDR